MEGRMGGGSTLDVRLLRALFQGQGLAPVNARARTSLRAIAAELGVSESTVRNRLLRLRESAFIKDVRLIANPALMGCGEANVLFDVPRQDLKDEVAEEALLLEDTIIVAVFHDRLVSVIFRFRGEPSLSRRIRLIQRLAKVEHVTVGRIPFPPCTASLSSLDWALLRALHREPSKSHAAVARELDVSSRTVRRRLERLLTGCAAFVFPTFDVCKAPGGTMGTLFVQYPTEKKPEVDYQVRARLADNLFTVFHMLPYRDSDPTFCAYNFIVPNVPKGNDILREVRKISGIQATRLEWFERVTVNYEPFAEDLRSPRGTPIDLPRERMGSASLVQVQR